jgi:hypothetical protein
LVSSLSILHTVTLVSAVLIFILLCAEFTTYLTSNIHTEMTLDGGKSSKIHISLNITFHALSCQQAKMDVMDVAGSQVLDMAHLEIHKQRLDASGRSLGRAAVVTTKTVEPPFMQMLRAFLPGLVQDVCAASDAMRPVVTIVCLVAVSFSLSIRHSTPCFLFARTRLKIPTRRAAMWPALCTSTRSRAICTLPLGRC